MKTDAIKSQKLEINRQKRHDEKEKNKEGNRVGREGRRFRVAHKIKFIIRKGDFLKLATAIGTENVYWFNVHNNFIVTYFKIPINLHANVTRAIHYLDLVYRCNFLPLYATRWLLSGFYFFPRVIYYSPLFTRFFFNDTHRHVVARSRTHVYTYKQY